MCHRQEQKAANARHLPIPSLYQHFVNCFRVTKPIPVAERSKMSVYGRSLAGIAGSNLAGGMDDCYECGKSSGRGLYDGPIPRPEECYRLWCVIVCDLQTSRMRGGPGHRWAVSPEKTNTLKV
jgi:hypothetical protein